MCREVLEGGGSTRGARVPSADVREPGSRKPMVGRRGGRAVEERSGARVARKAKATGEGAEPEARRRMVGSATEEVARGAVKEAAQEAVEKTTQEAVREAAQEAAQGAIYWAVQEAVQEAAHVAATVATRKAAPEAAQGAVHYAVRKAAQEAVHRAALEGRIRVAKWCEGADLGKEVRPGRAEGGLEEPQPAQTE